MVVNLFPSINNSRELGGILLGGGRNVKHNLIFRTSCPNKADENDKSRMKELGIKILYDFRSEDERIWSPELEVPGIENINIPIMNISGNMFGEALKKSGSDLSQVDKNVTEFIMSPGAKILFEDFYTSFIIDPECQKGYSKFFRTIIDAGCPPIMFHCTHGKDRTGLAAAYMLFALGADRETVVKDYIESYDHFLESMTYYTKIVKEKGGTESEFEIVRGIYGVNLRWFNLGLDLLYGGKYSSPISYLQDCLLLSSEDIDTLKKAYSD